MDELDDLATAARDNFRKRRVSRTSNTGTIITVVIVVAVVIVGGGMLINSAMKPPPPPPVADDSADRAERQRQREAQAAEALQALHMRFNEFAKRLADHLGTIQAAELKAHAQQTGDVYNCAYTVRKTEVLRGADGSPTNQCTVQLGGTVELDDGTNTNTDSYTIDATFQDTPAGWKLQSATQTRTAHHGSADLFRAPDEIGKKREMTYVDWFNAGVNAAQSAHAATP